VLPKSADFSDTESEISYDTGNENQAALISYSYNGVFIGSVSVDLAANTTGNYTFESIDVEAGEETEDTTPDFVFINVFKILLYILIAAAAVGVILGIRFILVNYSAFTTSSRRRWQLQRLKKRLFVKNNSLTVKRRKEVAEARRRMKKTNRRNRRNAWKRRIR
jgi:D-alanyl-D-alanine carboxypeptidase (penicillin-binding protein 5/6)